MKSIMDYLREKIRFVDTIVISDYAKGVISEELVEEVISLAKKKGKPVAVDPKVSHFDYYKYATIVTPNNDEASQASGVDIESDSSLLRAGEVLLNKLGSDAVLITRGEHGMSLFENNGGKIQFCSRYCGRQGRNSYSYAGRIEKRIGGRKIAIKNLAILQTGDLPAIPPLHTC